MSKKPNPKTEYVVSRLRGECNIWDNEVVSDEELLKAFEGTYIIAKLEFYYAVKELCKTLKNDVKVSYLFKMFKAATKGILKQ